MKQAEKDMLNFGMQMFGMHVEKMVETPDGEVMLCSSPSVPGCLAIGVGDEDGDIAVIPLSVAKTTELRDALNTWLDQQS